MSIPFRRNNCSEFAAAINDVSADFRQWLASQLTSQLDIIPLQLTADQLPLLAILSSKNRNRISIVTDTTLLAAQRLASAGQDWQDALTATGSWYLLAGELTEPERSGQIITHVSLATHALLRAATTARSYFVIPLTKAPPAIPDPAAYAHATLHVAAGQVTRLADVVARLIDNGYVRHTTTIEPGGIRVRGEQIDVCHPTLTGHITITFLGNRIESIVQRQGNRSRAIPTAAIAPMKFPAETVPLASALRTHVVIRPGHAAEFIGQPTVVIDSLVPAYPFPLASRRDIGAAVRSQHCLVVAQNRDRIARWLKEHQAAMTTICSARLARQPFCFLGKDTVLLSETAIFPTVTAAPVRPISYARAIELIGRLTIGRPAVHADHGIGIFEGLQRRTFDHQEREYLVLRYAQGDMLSVPVEYAHKVTPYLGQAAPVIHRLGGTLWIKTRRRAQADAARFAKELLDLAQKRAQHRRPPYHFSDELEKKLHQESPFAMTADQWRTWQEVQADLESHKPMDRLVVGDVGFGKTEIALRAAAHVAGNHRQVALLAPTTLLVQQHADTLGRRLAWLGNRLAVLSRLTPATEQKDIRRRIAQGAIDVVIGTHALLSPTISWSNLGLVIIDEEQRFGVRQKEYFKKLRAEVDVLSLSATPIPRTLSMALSGLRQLSLISTPPPGRLGVKTRVVQQDDAILRQAIAQEMARGGQVYVVAPKIRQLSALAETIARLLPHARLAIAHGRLPANRLSTIMHRFDGGEIDVLVSSSIVENGLDLPNVNTLIVWHATDFGLADLYQLRGRIGRRQRQGYAYFLFNQQELTSLQRQRLAVLTEASRLGSGWSLAQRDLEIRGAGNLLGAEQSGTVNAVGVQFYLDLIRQAAQATAGGSTLTPDVDIQLPLPAALPAHYIADSSERIRWYQRLGRSTSAQALREVTERLKQMYGPLPAEAQNLTLLLHLQRAARQVGITKIIGHTISPPGKKPYARLEVRGESLPNLLRILSPLGQWVVKDNALILDVAQIAPQLVHQVIEVCSKETDKRGIQK